MNQILSMGGGMDTPNGNMNNSFKNNNGSGKGPLETRTTVLIFAIVLIVFGLAMSGMGIINLVNSLNPESVIDSRWPVYEPKQVDNKLYLTISNDKVIDKVLYRWNGGFDTTVSGDGMTFIPLELIVPIGDNMLTVTVVDIDGKEYTPYQRRFTGLEIEEEPVIEYLGVPDLKMVNIVAKSTTSTKLSYMTYKWNNGEEVKIEPTVDDYSITTQLNTPVGKNELVVTAVKENGMKKTIYISVTGLTKPVITFSRENPGYVEVTIEHESGIASATVTLDGKEKSVTQDQFGEDKKVVVFMVYLKPNQRNLLTVKATSCDGTTADKSEEG